LVSFSSEVSFSRRRSLSLFIWCARVSFALRMFLYRSSIHEQIFPPTAKKERKKKPTETCRAELSTFLSTCVENYFSTFTAYILCLSDCLTAPLPCSPPCPSPSYAPYFSFLLPPPSSLLPPPSFLFSLPQLFQPKLRQCLRIVAAAPVEKFWV